MSFSPSPSALTLAAVALVLVGAALVVAGIAALLRVRLLSFAFRSLAGVALLAIGALAGMLGLGLQGFEALTREETAARIVVRPTGVHRFEASVRFADGRQARFDLAGDFIYVDADILKWKPVGNVLGLHTTYQLDRIGGRYRSLEQETSATRTIYSLAPTAMIDLVALRRRFPVLARLFDAEYGSATYVEVARPAELEVRVSTSGLLMREAAASR